MSLENRNQQDITLFAIRRTGKSALINHIFNHLKESYDCLYVDLWGTTSLFGFINEAANAEIGSPGTMQAVINALREKQVIIREGKAYRLYDVFLEHYLRYFG